MKASRLAALCAWALWLVMAANSWSRAPADEAARVHALATQLRCPVCQNQTLADSNADLARDLRDEISRQVAAGRSDEDIRRFMTQRYGSFVLYDPPLAPSTALLWGLPFALLLAVAVGWWWRVRDARWDEIDTPSRTPDRETLS